MPLLKFRDPDDARRALWSSSADPALPRRIRRLWERARRLCPLGIPRGLRKFRTIEEANQERHDWTQRRIRALRADR